MTRHVSAKPSKDHLYCGAAGGESSKVIIIDGFSHAKFFWKYNQPKLCVVRQFGNFFVLMENGRIW
jgi:hypothetical protein